MKQMKEGSTIAHTIAKAQRPILMNEDVARIDILMNEVVAKRRQKTDPRPKRDASHSTPASFTLQTQKLIRALRMDVDRRWSRARNYRIDSLRSTTTSKLRI